MAGPVHKIHDTDAHFIIDPITRAIKNETHKKLSIVVCDHNSEVFTFELPRHIEGHDMAKCNKVEIHYANTHSATKEKSADRYKVADFAVDPSDAEKILFSWTLDDKTTKYPGSLAFACHFKCIDELTEKEHYKWSTAANNTITVLDSIDLTPAEGEEATDLQEKTATPTKSTQVVSPDGSFRGLRRVVVEPIPDEYIIPTGTLLVDANGNYEIRDFDKVIVDVPEVPPVLQEKEITANGAYTPDRGYDGFGKVTVAVANAPTLQEKIVYPATSQQAVTPDSGYDGLSKVRVEPVRLQDKTVNRNGQVVPDMGFMGLDTVTVNVQPGLQDKTINVNGSGTVEVISDSGYDGLGKVTVNASLPKAKMQTKTATKNGEYIPDSGYDGLDRVTVAVKPRMQSKSVSINASMKVDVLPDQDYDGLDKVTITTDLPERDLQSKSIDIDKRGKVDIIPDSGYYGLSKVSVDVDIDPELQKKTVKPSTSRQTITPDDNYDGLGEVVVDPIQLQRKTITKNGEFGADTAYGYNGLEKVTVDVTPELQSKTVKPSTSRHTVTPDSNYDGLGEVIVEPIQLQTKTITANGEYRADTAYGYNGLEKVTVDVAPELQSKSIDISTRGKVDVVPDSGFYGLSKVSIDAAFKPELQSKTLKPSTSRQTVTPDSGYDGLGEVAVDPIQLQGKTIDVNGSGTVEVISDSGYDGLSKVTVNASLPTPKMQTKKATQNGEYIPDSGYDGLEKVTVDVQPRMQSKSISINASMEVDVLPDRDYDGLSKVTITTDLPERDLQSKSIDISTRGKVDIIPDSGYYGLSKVSVDVDIDPELQKKTVKPSTSRQTVTPDDNYDGLGEVVVDPIQLQRKTITKNGDYEADTAYGYNGLEKVTVDVAPELQSKTVKPSASRQTVTPDGNFDGLGAVVVEPIQLQEKTITANGEYQADTAYGYNGLEKVTVKVEPKLQKKTLKFTQNSTTEVIPDSGYEGLSKVEVTVNVDPAPFINTYIAEKIGGKY